MIATKVTPELMGKLGVKSEEELRAALETLGESGGVAFLAKVGELVKVVGDLSPAAVAEAIAASKDTTTEADAAILAKIPTLETALGKLRSDFDKYAAEHPAVDVKAVAAGAAAEAVATAIAAAGGEPLTVTGANEAKMTKAEALTKYNELNAQDPAKGAEFYQTHKKLLTS